jgi:hypothetical protein
MALPTPTGYIDIVQNIVIPENTGTWADLTTWDDWTNYISAPSNPMTWVTDILDLQEEQDFNLIITTSANGTVEYDVYTSSTGAFAGEETMTTIAQGDTGIASFSGRYCAVAVKVTQVAGINSLTNVSLKANNFQIQDRMSAVDTSALAGTSADRTLVPSKTFSKVTNLQITPITVTAYAVDLYVSSTATSTHVIPKIISKGINPHFALVGIDNQPRDATVDITITGLPELYMDGNNLKTR